MMMKKLVVLKEGGGQQLVALTPKNVEQLKSCFEIHVEREAGLVSGFTDEQYAAAGAHIVSDRIAAIDSADVVLSFESQLKEEVIRGNKTFVGFFNVKNQPAVLNAYIKKATHVYSLDLIARTSLAQSMDILSSVASLSGYQAVLMAAEMSPHVVPMLTTAGGTLRPSRFLIIGAGVAGLQAIATAKRLGARVQAFDVRKATRTEVESLGASFIEIDGAVDMKKAGGYAVEQSSAYMQKVSERLAEESAKADVIITTAKIPGKKAPVLITAETVAKMKPGSIIIDLAAETGGNCALTKRNEEVVVHGVRIVGYASVLSRSASSASYLVANNFTSFLQHYCKHIHREEQDDILLSTKVIENGKMIHQQLIEEINTL
jgi:NAD(P) transhydrogenase subunit alpha